MVKTRPAKIVLAGKNSLCQKFVMKNLLYMYCSWTQATSMH